MTTAKEIIDAAISYACGWHVFPVVGKRPARRHGFHDAVATTDEVRNLFGRYPEAKASESRPAPAACS
jgi:bifunctional DNA primase/polymerase-like protein